MFSGGEVNRTGRDVTLEIAKWSKRMKEYGSEDWGFCGDVLWDIGVFPHGGFSELYVGTLVR
jgi:hypothetical protein